MATKTYKALSPVKHNGVRYERGETIEGLDSKQAKVLVDSGVAVSGKIEEPSNDSGLPGAQVDNAKLWELDREALNAEAHNRGFNNPEQFELRAQLVEALVEHTVPTGQEPGTEGNPGSDEPDNPDA